MKSSCKKRWGDWIDRKRNTTVGHRTWQLLINCAIATKLRNYTISWRQCRILKTKIFFWTCWLYDIPVYVSVAQVLAQCTGTINPVKEWAIAYGTCSWESARYDWRCSTTFLTWSCFWDIYMDLMLSIIFSGHKYTRFSLNRRALYGKEEIGLNRTSSASIGGGEMRRRSIISYNGLKRLSSALWGLKSRLDGTSQTILPGGWACQSSWLYDPSKQVYPIALHERELRLSMRRNGWKKFRIHSFSWWGWACASVIFFHSCRRYNHLDLGTFDRMGIANCRKVSGEPLMSFRHWRWNRICASLPYNGAAKDRRSWCSWGIER